MSSTLKTVLQRQYKSGLARWPQENLRPDVQLQATLREHLADRIAGHPIGGPAISKRIGATPPFISDLAKLQQVNALLALVDDRFKTANRLSSGFLAPRSNPTYYHDILNEIEEAPKRTYLQWLRLKFKYMFRWSE